MADHTCKISSKTSVRNPSQLCTLIHSILMVIFIKNKTKPILHPAKNSLIKLMLKKDLPYLTYDFKFLHTELHEWGSQGNLQK